MNPNPGRFFKIYFFNEAEFSNFLFYAYFYAKTLDLGLESKKKLSFWWIFSLLDPLIFADPNPGTQNLTDPTVPDPKH